MNKGYVIIAQNSGATNYIKCAEILCKSIKHVMKDASVSLITDKHIENKNFDKIILFPHGDYCINDTWKLANDWQVYEASPYDYTIKLEADMYIPRSIAYWWDILSMKDLVISTCIRNYKNEISSSRFYRKIIDDNLLPDTYNAITYFKKSKIASNFFAVVKDIFINWDLYKSMLNCPKNESATTDVVYSIAANIIGVKNCTLPTFTEFSMIHMKQMIADTAMTTWTKELLYEIDLDTIRINTIPQLYPFHYHVKNFCFDIERELNDGR